jgi:hypothetical protein
MTREYGTLVVHGVRLPIIDIRLRNGQIYFLAQSGVGDYEVRGPITVFGEDGIGVFQGGDCAPARSKRGRVTLDVPLRVLETNS